MLCFTTQLFSHLFRLLFQTWSRSIRGGRMTMTNAPCCSKWEGLPIPMPNLVTNMPRTTPPHSFGKTPWSSRCLLHILSHLVTPKISSKMTRFWPDRKLKGYQNTDYNVLRKKRHVFRIRCCYSMEPTVVFSFASFFETRKHCKTKTLQSSAASDMAVNLSDQSRAILCSGSFKTHPSEKRYARQFQVGLNMNKNIWSHHLVCCYHQSNQHETNLFQNHLHCRVECCKSIYILPWQSWRMMANDFVGMFFPWDSHAWSSKLWQLIILVY